MPPTGRSVASPIQGHGRNSKTSPTDADDDGASSQTNTGTVLSHAAPPGTEPVHSPAAITAAATQQRPGLKNRAYSAPIVPRTNVQPRGPQSLDDSSAADLTDNDEIAGDPFFQRYNSLIREKAPEEEEETPSSAESSSDTEGPHSPTLIKNRPSTASDPPSSPKSPGLGQEHQGTMQEINIGVLGAQGVGKTNFIQHALDLRVTPSASTSYRKMAIDGNIYVVRLLELSFDHVHIGEDGRVSWPETIDKMSTPRIDGALALYDVMNNETFAPIPGALSAIRNSNLPCALVSCKCDHHPAHRQVDTEEIEKSVRDYLGDVTMPVFQTAHSAPDTQKRCLSYMLRLIVSGRTESPKVNPNRPRSSSTAVGGYSSPRQSWNVRHERASSEYSASKTKGHMTGSYNKDAEGGGVLGSVRSHQSHHHHDNPSVSIRDSFLDNDESSGPKSTVSDARSSDQERGGPSPPPSDEKGYTFDHLVDRLLSQPLSKIDAKFSSIFLALYRHFATPGQLLEAIIRRFEALKRDKSPHMIKTIAQLRHLAILEQWVSYYPGDFAYPSTRRKMRRFVSGLVSNRIFSIAAREMTQDLEAVVEDDDTDWACSDRNRDSRTDYPEKFLSSSTALDEDSEDEDIAKVMSGLDLVSDGSQISISRTATTRSGTLSVNTASTGGSLQNILTSVEAAQRQAKQLVPTGRMPLSKTQWHLFMGLNDDDIAKELTRIDWIMFSSIRPRDLVRHVSLSAEEKKKCKNLENVNRMIDHFNHLAYLVSNYILLRDKPKHRAMMMEKWMKVARKLREFNNYSSLGAILAGINSTAIHRLSLTRSLITAPTGKDFMKLEILMGSQKSHFAYRLAWENSSGERIPYVPLHRRDLVSAAEGNPTFVGAGISPHPGVSVFPVREGRGDVKEAPPGGITGKERINWRKFEIMGEVIVGVQRAQGTPYPKIAKNEDIKPLLLDVTFIKDEDELYERSIKVESPSMVGSKRSIFGRK